MKRIAFTLTLGVFLIIGTNAQPKLAVDNMTIDLGTIYSGQIKTSRIVIRNIGNQPLKILSVQPSCGCTTVHQPRTELKPNDSDEVEVSFNSSLYRGAIEKYVNIETNDPLSQYVSVKLIAVVKDELVPTTSSYSVWLGNITVGKKYEQPITFTNVTENTIAIQGISSTSPQVTAESAQKRVRPSDTLTVKLTAAPEKVGYDSCYLSIKTDSKNQPTVELKVYYIAQKDDQ